MDLPIGSLVLRMRNFQFLDPGVTGEGKKGMSHVAKADKEIFQEFQNDWGNLGAQAEEIVGLALFDGTPEKAQGQFLLLRRKIKSAVSGIFSGPVYLRLMKIGVV